MKVTKVKYFPINRKYDSHPVAACCVVFDGVFMVHDIKVFEGGVVTMPQRTVKKKDYTETNRTGEDVCHPVDSEFFQELRAIILDGYYLYESTGNNIYIPEKGVKL